MVIHDHLLWNGGRSSDGGCGCLSIVVFCLLMWALVFGVTVEGKHYAIGCSCDEGVAVRHEP